MFDGCNATCLNMHFVLTTYSINLENFFYWVTGFSFWRIHIQNFLKDPKENSVNFGTYLRTHFSVLTITAKRIKSFNFVRKIERTDKRWNKYLYIDDVHNAMLVNKMYNKYVKLIKINIKHYTHYHDFHTLIQYIVPWRFLDVFYHEMSNIMTFIF